MVSWEGILGPLTGKTLVCVPGGGGDGAYVIYMHIRSIPAETGIQCFLPYSKNSNNRTRDWDVGVAFAGKV